MQWWQTQRGSIFPDVRIPAGPWSNRFRPTITRVVRGHLSAAFGLVLLVTAACTERSDPALPTGASASLSLQSIGPENPQVAVGKTIQLRALDQNGTPLNARWSSSNSNVATVSSAGEAIGIQAGTVTITAAWRNLSTSTELTVVAAEADDPTRPRVEEGEEPAPPPSEGVPADAVSVKAFGAVGDGEADDVAAFREAIASAGKKGVAVYVPAGRYRLGSTLSIDYAVEVVGDGHARSVITANGGSARLLVRLSGTGFRDLGFEDMIEPIALVSRDGYRLENLSLQRCRFERMISTSVNRGVIGLSSGNSSQRPYRIHNLVVRECVFRQIDAHAINIRGNISSAQILNNQFLDIVNSRGEGVAPAGGFAIRLGESSDDAGLQATFAPMTHHRIEGNVIRRMRKSTVAGNLVGMLIYGNYHTIQHNLIEDIDGTAEGMDVDALYIRGAYNRVLHNTIRNVRGADDDGALAFKGGLDLGSVNNVIAYNTIEDIHGLSAIEVSTTNLHLHDNVVRNAPRRGFYQRGGEGLIMEKNSFTGANLITRSPSGKTYIRGNHFTDSFVTLSTGGRTAANREGVWIHGNRFERSDAGRSIGLANDVQENFISLVGNDFSKADHTVDFIANGSVRSVERKENTGTYTYRGP